MELHQINDHWEYLDFLKALTALLSGAILGLERELKDKSAGLRTITLISLGCCLFTILSYKMGIGNSQDATRIASYIVSGVGFLGAGVIFKDAYSINGLTTASIIWIASAIGMCIGFGQFGIAFIFLLTSLFIVHFGSYINKKYLSKKLLKNIEITVDKSDYKFIKELKSQIKNNCKKTEIKRIICVGNDLQITYECKILAHKYPNILDFLLQNPKIKGFVI